MNRYSTPLTAIALAAAALLSACGGGGTTADTTAPTVTISDNMPGTATGDVTFTFTFNEAVTGFTTDDITVTNGTKGAFAMATNGLSATLVVTPPSTGSGNIEVAVAAGTFSDTANNANTAAASGSQAFGTAAPAAFISFDENPAINGEIKAYGGALPDLVTGPSGGSGKALKITKPAGAGKEVWGGSYFSVPTVPFTAAQKAITARVYSTVANAEILLKVEKPNGSDPCTECTEVKGTTVSQANTWTTVTWDFSAAVLTRAHTSLAITPDPTRALDGATYYIDDIRIVDTPPSVTITDNVSGTATGAVTFTFTFNKAVSGFTADDVTVTNGTKGAFVMATDSLSATLVVTPPSTGSGSIGISLAAGTFADSSGNNNIAGATSSQAYGPAFVGYDIVRVQTATQNSYVVAANTPVSTSLPGNNDTGGYAWGGIEEWWSGVGTDSVYKGVGIAAADAGGFGVFVKGAGATTWDINGASSIEVGLGTNPTCVGTCAATIILKATDNCIATINTPFTILTESVNTGNAATQVNGAIPRYTRDLIAANWTVSGCTTNTVEAFKQLPLKEVHAQMLRANMQTTTTAAGSAKYANGLNLGAIKIQ